MKRKIIELILIIIAYVFQSTLGMAISLGGIHPNILVLLPVMFGFLHGSNEGIFVGFFAGLMYDMYYSSIVGFSSLIFLFAGYFSGLFYQKYEETEIVAPIFLSFAFNLIFEIVMYTGNFLLHNKLDFIYYFNNIIMPETVYTVIAAIILYKPVAFLNRQLDKPHKRRTSNVDQGNI